MLKQSSSRNMRAKSLKVKHAIQIFVIVALCVWFLYHVKQSYSKKEAAMEEKGRPEIVSGNGENEYQIMKIGRKHLKPRLDEEFGKQGEEEVDVEDVRENEGEDEIDKEKSEEAEPDQLQDFIDEDDKDA